MEKEKRHFRKLSELSLIDDYLFGLFIQEAGSDEVLKGLIERMLDIKVQRIRKKESQHEILNDPNLLGIRLDAYLEDENHTIYNIEVQVANKRNTAKRMRYYQSLIDREAMPSGEYDYSKLPKTIIIFITDFDPFGKGLYRYTFKNICIEDNTILLNDESIKVFLNTRGTNIEGVKPELVELLKYFRNSTKDTVSEVSSDFVKSLDKMLEPIRNSPKFGGDFMSLQEKIYESNMEVSERSRQEGREEGRQEGINEILAKLRKSGFTTEQIQDILRQ